MLPWHLQLIAIAGLITNPVKGKFGNKKTMYMGCTVGGVHICPLADKVQALTNYSIPMTKKQVRQFLGVAEYSRCFVPNFATIAAPLIYMTRNHRKCRSQTIVK